MHLLGKLKELTVNLFYGRVNSPCPLLDGSPTFLPRASRGSTSCRLSFHESKRCGIVHLDHAPGV